jgi:hypothetical protein
MNNTFVVSGIRFYNGSNPTIQLFKNPNSGKYVACFMNFDTEESIDGYDYHEILSIRNTLTEILNQIDTREVIDEIVNDEKYYDPNLEDDGA